VLNEIKNRLKVMCVSYTITTIFYLLLFRLNIADEINDYITIRLLLLNFFVAVLMMMTDRLKVKNKYFSIFIDLFDVFFVVFLLGSGFFKLFSFNLHNIVMIIVMGTIIYFGVFFIVTYKNVKDAKAINKKLKSEREKKDE